MSPVPCNTPYIDRDSGEVEQPGLLRARRSTWEAPLRSDQSPFCMRIPQRYVQKDAFYTYCITLYVQSMDYHILNLTAQMLLSQIGRANSGTTLPWYAIWYATCCFFNSWTWYIQVQVFFNVIIIPLNLMTHDSWFILHFLPVFPFFQQIFNAFPLCPGRRSAPARRSAGGGRGADRRCGGTAAGGWGGDTPRAGHLAKFCFFSAEVS